MGAPWHHSIVWRIKHRIKHAVIIICRRMASCAIIIAKAYVGGLNMWLIASIPAKHGNNSQLSSHVVHLFPGIVNQRAKLTRFAPGGVAGENAAWAPTSDAIARGGDGERPACWQHPADLTI